MKDKLLGHEGMVNSFLQLQHLDIKENSDTLRSVFLLLDEVDKSINDNETIIDSDFKDMMVVRLASLRRVFENKEAHWIPCMMMVAELNQSRSAFSR